MVDVMDGRTKTHLNVVVLSVSVRGAVELLVWRIYFVERQPRPQQRYPDVSVASCVSMPDTGLSTLEIDPLISVWWRLMVDSREA